jgi:hypothetical protein
MPWVAGDEVPPTLPGDQVVGLDLHGVVAVVAADAVVVADRQRDGLEDGSVDRRVLDVAVRVGRPGRGRLDQCGELAAEPVGQHLLQLGEGAGAGLLDAGDARGRAQPDGHRHGFLVVEEEGRQLRPDPEAIAAAGSADGVDGVPQLPEPGHVVANRSVGHVEAARQVRAGPVGPRLEQ